MYGRCLFAERCSFLHFSFSRRDHIASNVDKLTEQNVSELKEEVRTLRVEVDRLGKHLLGLIKDLKEEIDVARVKRLESDSKVPAANSTRNVMDSRQQIVQLCGELAGRDEETLTDALDGIAAVLDTAENLDDIYKVATMAEECGGMNRINQLQHFKSEQIYHKCLSILETFFPDDFDQMEEEIFPVTIKEDKGNENRHDGKNGHKGRKKAQHAAPVRSNGSGREQNVQWRT